MAGGRGMGPRLHGDDDGRRAHPTIVMPATSRGRRWVPVSTGTTVAPISSFPRRRESMAGGRRGWVPVSTGTTMGGGGAPHNRHSRDSARAAMGIPSFHGNDGRTREAAGIHGHPYRHSRGGGNPWRRAGRGWVPVSTGTTEGGGGTTVGGPSCPWRGSGGTLCCRPTS